MARQSLRKRQYLYKERIQKEYDRFRTLLLRQQIRLNRGDYKEILLPKEVQKIKDLLWKALPFIPHGFKAVALNSKALDEPRRVYYQICKILRKAGRRTRPIKSSKIVIRRNTNALSSGSKNFDQPKACAGVKTGTFSSLGTSIDQKRKVCGGRG